ncbi:MAG: hypothetical protein ACOC6Q_00370 [Patescibacteria group bacterium]
MKWFTAQVAPEKSFELVTEYGDGVCSSCWRLDDDRLLPVSPGGEEIVLNTDGNRYAIVQSENLFHYFVLGNKLCTIRVPGGLSVEPQFCFSRDRQLGTPVLVVFGVPPMLDLRLAGEQLGFKFSKSGWIPVSLPASQMKVMVKTDYFGLRVVVSPKKKIVTSFWKEEGVRVTNTPIVKGKVVPDHCRCDYYSPQILNEVFSGD